VTLIISIMLLCYSVNSMFNTLVTSASLSANVVKIFSVSANGKKNSFRIYANGANILRLSTVWFN
jgi:hypothetical protein